MNFPLVLLTRFRQVGAWRAFARSGRGSPIAMVGKGLVFLVWMGMLAGWISGIAFSLTAVRNEIVQSWLQPLVNQAASAAPFAMLGFLAFLFVLSLFDRPFKFSPAEENFLIAGPFGRRQLLNYKIGTVLLGAFVVSLIAAPMGAFVSSIWSAFVGSMLVFSFFSVFSLAVGQVGSITGLSGAGGMRRLGVTLVVIAVVLAVGWGAYGRLLNDPARLYRMAERSRGLRTAMTPLRWFVEAFTAKRLWPDLVKWSSLCFAVNAALVVMIYALDARIQRREDAEERGHAPASETERPAPVRVRRAFPLFARCGGAGSIAWRQAMMATRKPQQLFVVAMMYSFLLFMIIMLSRYDDGIVFIRNFDGSTELNPVGARVLGPLAVILPMLIASGLSFDFRGEVGQMDVLKALPAGPVAVTVGQLCVPVAIASALQWLAMVAAVVALWRVPPGLWVAATFVPPLSVVVMVIENLPTFWFPLRKTEGAQPEPFETVGHALLQPILRGIGFIAVAVTTALVAAVAYFAFGQSVAAAVVAAWLTLVVGGIALVALLAKAFDMFDVTQDLSVH